MQKYDLASISAADLRRAEQLRVKVRRLRRIVLRSKASSATLADVHREIRACHRRIDTIEKRLAILERLAVQLREARA